MLAGISDSVWAEVREEYNPIRFPVTYYEATGETEGLTSQDRKAIDKLHCQEIAAAKVCDFEALKSLTDASCMVFPPDSDPSAGKAYLDHLCATLKVSEPNLEVLELDLEWEELLDFGCFVFEQGVVRYAVQKANGSVLRESRRLQSRQDPSP